MARAKTRTERLKVRSSQSDILTFLVRRLTLRADRTRGGFMHETTTHTEVRDGQGRVLEQVTDFRFRCPATGEEFTVVEAEDAERVR